jgi:hypothetical protein
LVIPPIETDDPTLAKHLSDKLDPSVAKLNILKLEPSRTTDLMDIEEPKFTASKTDKLEILLTIPEVPSTDRYEAILTKPRTDIAEPR